jgi:MoaA/NifB/PqqE/SkfB family radical SAM enzyme
MTAADFAEVVHQVAFCKPTITLFGGEPLVFKGWDTVAQHAKAANLRCRIVTNGLLVEKYASRIVELGIDKVNVSIDGPAPINDEVRGVKGGYEKAIKGIHAVNAVKKARGVNLPLMSIVCTISQDNHAYLVDLAEGVKELPLSSLVYQHLTFITKERYEEHNRIFSKHLQKASEVCKGFVLNHENLDPQVLVSQLHRLSHSEYRFPVLFRPGFSPREVVEYYTNPSYERGSHQVCVAPWREAYVMPDGSLTPCLDYVVGNVRETPFRKLWNNTAFCRFRAAVKKHGRFPFCHKCCN